MVIAPILEAHPVVEFAALPRLEPGDLVGLARIAAGGEMIEQFQGDRALELVPQAQGDR